MQASADIPARSMMQHVTEVRAIFQLLNGFSRLLYLLFIALGFYKALFSFV